MSKERSASPKVTVLMSVYNAREYLREAIESILNQTFKDFEFLIIDDGSTDGSEQIIRSYGDPRIRLVCRENKGLIYSLNQGLRLARGEYIARMDADDRSFPQRLARQVAFLDEHSHIGMVGSNYIIINEAGRQVGESNIFTSPDDLKVALVISNQFGHGSVMLRKSVLGSVGGYSPKMLTVEDYDLWTRISRVSGVANLKQPFYLWRRRARGISLSNQKLQIDSTLKIAHREFGSLLRNRTKYKVFTSWHPWVGSTLSYFWKKSDLFQDLAYFFRVNGKVGWAYLALLYAIILAPWKIRSYFYLLILPSLKRVEKSWRYIYL